MYAIIDVETTGGSPATDRVIEIAVIVHDGQHTIQTYSTLLNPNRPIDPYVTKLTGITNEMVKNSPTFQHIHQKILELTHENIFVAHNVKFDFGMLRQEFKRLGIDFNRRQLDTVNLARKTIPGFNSYSLGNICDSLGIHIENRHRALGDAEATAKLLEIVLTKNTAAKYIEIELNHGIDIDLLPPYLSKAEIEKLPEDAGVFYYKDELGRILYLEGVKNIRKKVINYFSAPVSTAPEKVRLFELIRNIDYELSGNELVAKLIAHRDARQHQPEFNKKIKVLPTTHAIFLQYDEQGFAQLKVHDIHEPAGEIVLRFGSKPTANKVLAKINKEGGLLSWYALRAKLLEAATPPEPKTLRNYNRVVQKAIGRYLYRQPNFFIIAEGIHPESLSAVCIEGNQYKGFGYFDPELTPANPENLREIIKPADDDFDTQKIIRNYLRKMKNAKIIAY